jgi:hypothetical protein
MGKSAAELTTLSVLKTLNNSKKNRADENTYIRIGCRYLTLLPFIYSDER